MNQQFETAQKFGKDGIEATLKSLGALSRGLQAATADAADYTKRSFEQGTAALEKLSSARSLDKALEVQTEYARTAYEGLVAQASKMGELVTATAKEVAAPLEGLVAKTNPGAQTA